MTNQSTSIRARHHLSLAALCVFLASPGMSRGTEQDSASTVSGRIIDQESSEPIEGAIVYIVSSSVGVSTGADGSFRIVGLPPGSYDVVASHVGYERATRSVTLRDTGAVVVDFALKPKAVPTAEIEVLADRERLEKPDTELYFPNFDARQYCIFPSGDARPIGTLFTDSAFYMYSLDVVIRDSEKYVWLWLLYQNLSEDRHVIHPRRDLTLDVIGDTQHAYRKIPPLTGTETLALGSTEEAGKEILEKIGGALHALSEYQRRIRPGYSHITGAPFDAAGGTDPDLSGTMVVRHDAARAASGAGLSSEYLSRTFHDSFHAGILGRYAVFPGNTVDGLVCFPYPGSDWRSSGDARGRNARGYRYELHLATPTGVREIVFHAN